MTHGAKSPLLPFWVQQGLLLGAAMGLALLMMAGTASAQTQTVQTRSGEDV